MMIKRTVARFGESATRPHFRSLESNQSVLKDSPVYETKLLKQARFAPVGARVAAGVYEAWLCGHVPPMPNKRSNQVLRRTTKEPDASR
jgi:hypothetical protein